MKIIALTLTCMLLAPAALAGDAVGEKWVECKIGQGGLASAEHVYRGVASALDKGDVAALAALVIDRCTLFRIASTAGYDIAATIREGRDAMKLERDVSMMHARIQVDGVKLGATPFEVVKAGLDDGEHTITDDEGNVIDVFPFPLVTIATRMDMRLRISMRVVAVDGRWFLYAAPTMTGSDEALDKRYGVLVRDLAKRIGTRQGDKAVAVVDAWQKKHEAELTKLGLAGQATKSSAARKAMALLQTSIGALDQVLAKRLESLGLSPKRTGIASCDEYLARMDRCIPMLPPAAQGAITEAMAQATEAWRQAAESGPEAATMLEGACKQVLDSMAGAMQAMCPGAW